MSIHFNTLEDAVVHLYANGWRQIKNGNWVSRNKTVAAHILRAHGDVVLVQMWEIE